MAHIWAGDKGPLSSPADRPDQLRHNQKSFQSPVVDNRYLNVRALLKDSFIEGWFSKLVTGTL